MTAPRKSTFSRGPALSDYFVSRLHDASPAAPSFRTRGRSGVSGNDLRDGYRCNGRCGQGCTSNDHGDEHQYHQRTKTDSSGQYVVPFLQPGTYQIVVEMASFKKVVRNGVTLQVWDSAGDGAWLQPIALN